MTMLEVPLAVALAFMTVAVTLYVSIGVDALREVTFTVVGADPDQLLPSYSQCVLTWKLAEWSCWPLTV
jgi:hypothetical protein